MIGCTILAAIAALLVAAIAAVTTIRISARAAGDPIVRITIVWPSGAVTYQWPKADDR